MGATASKFSCEACGKSYTWKADLGGRRVKCKCGQVLHVPADDPAAAAAVVNDEFPDFDDLLALGDGTPVEAATPPALGGGGETCPSCRAPLAAGAVLCVSCGQNLKTGKKLKTQKQTAAAATGASPARERSGYAAMGTKRGPVAAAAAGGNQFWSPVQDLYVPAALILVGVVLSFFEVRLGMKITSVPVAIGAVAVMTVINCVVGFAGILLASKFLDLGLGPLPVALLKTSAAAILPAAAASLVMSLLGPQLYGSGYIAWAISFALSLMIFIFLMDMDYQEVVICTAIIFIVRTFLAYALVGLIFAGPSKSDSIGGDDDDPSVASKGGGAAALNSVLGGDPEAGKTKKPPPPPPAHVIFDRHATKLLEYKMIEAKAWMAKWEKGRLSSLDAAQTKSLFDDLYAAGATEVKIVDTVNEIAGIVVVTLPTDKARRAKIFARYEKLEYAILPDYDEEFRDDGQKYLSIETREGPPE